VEPKQIALLLTEDVNINNGLILDSHGIRIGDDLDREIGRMITKLMPIITAIKNKGVFWGDDVVKWIDMIRFYNKYKKENQEIAIGIENNHKKYGAKAVEGAVIINIGPSQITAKWLRNTLDHEVGVHMQDPKRNLIRKDQASTANFQKIGNFPISYWLNPIELDAYIGGIVNSIRKYGKTHNQSEEEIQLTSREVEDTLEYMRNPSEIGVEGIFSGGKINAELPQNINLGLFRLGINWCLFHIYKKISSPKQWKMILSRIYNALSEVKVLLKNRNFHY
jgi:hypothetical protein